MWRCHVKSCDGSDLKALAVTRRQVRCGKERAVNYAIGQVGQKTLNTNVRIGAALPIGSLAPISLSANAPFDPPQQKGRYVGSHHPQAGGAHSQLHLSPGEENLLVGNGGRCRRPAGCVVDRLVRRLSRFAIAFRCCLAQSSRPSISLIHTVAQCGAGSLFGTRSQRAAGCSRRPFRISVGAVGAQLSRLASGTGVASSSRAQSSRTSEVHVGFAGVAAGVLQYAESTAGAVAATALSSATLPRREQQQETRIAVPSPTKFDRNVERHSTQQKASGCNPEGVSVPRRAIKHPDDERTIPVERATATDIRHDGVAHRSMRPNAYGPLLISQGAVYCEVAA